MSPISDNTLRGRPPRAGTITLGRTYKHNNGKLLPKKEAKPVFHTDDGVLANAILESLGGTVHHESEDWAHDVVIGSAEFDAYALPAHFSQWLETWKVAECVRRCDGEQMTVCNGERLLESDPCLCDLEIATGEASDRLCKPHSSLPLLIPLEGVARFAPWTLKATSWVSANTLKGAIDSLHGAGLGLSVVPVTIRAVETTVRNPDDKVQKAYEWNVQINVALSDLPGLAGSIPGASPALGDRSRPELNANSGNVDAAKAHWRTVLAELDGDDLEAMRAKFTDRFGTRKPDDLSDDEWIAWSDEVRAAAL